jgi:hypothetical protein
MKKLLLVLGFLALASCAFAQSSGHTPESAVAPKFPAFAKETLMATYVSSGAPFTIAPFGDSPIDAAHTVSCPGTSGTCLFQADVWVEIGWGTYGQVSICLYVDGSEAGTCYDSGQVPQDGGWVNVSSSVNAPGISVGNHKVQTHIYLTNNTATVGYYSIDYKVFKP